MKEYVLKQPIELKNADGQVLEKIEKITLTRLRGEHARKITADKPFPLMVQMIGCSANLPPSTMDKMDLEDIIGAAEVAGDFFTVPALKAPST